MKKIISIILIISMLFSVSSIALATDTQTITSDNYTNIINEKVKDENFFLKFIARLIILGVKLRFISIDKLNELYGSTSQEQENITTKPTTQPDYSVEDTTGDALKLHHSQLLPYTSRGITISDITITKEEYNGIRYTDNYSQVQKYRYHINIKGTTDNTDLCSYTSINLQFFSTVNDGSELRYYLFKDMCESNIDSTFKVDENGCFELDCIQYNIFFDYDIYHISLIEYMP